MRNSLYKSGIIMNMLIKAGGLEILQRGFFDDDFHSILRKDRPDISDAFRLAGEELEEIRKEFEERIFEENKRKVVEFINSEEKTRMIKTRPAFVKEMEKAHAYFRRWNNGAKKDGRCVNVRVYYISCVDF